MPGFPPNPLTPLSLYQTIAANPYQTTLLADTSSSVFSAAPGAMPGPRGGQIAGRCREWAVSRVWHFTGEMQVRAGQWQRRQAASHTDSTGLAQAGEAAAVGFGVHAGALQSAAVNVGALGGLGAKHELQ